MKNKEIEKILKYLKNNTYIPDETKRKYKILHRDEVNLLLSYIEQLEKENKTLGEIVNIKDEQLKEMQMQKTDYTAVNILELKIEKLENNRDKAIKKLNKYRNRKDHYGLWCMEYIDNADIIHILKGDSDYE